MDLRNLAAFGASTRPWMLWGAVLLAATAAGMGTAVVGSMAGDRAAYLVAILALATAGGIVAATRREPLRFAFLALIACFPLAAALVPPGRLGITVFDLLAFALTIGLLSRKLLASSGASAPLFPTASFQAAWLLVVPCVVFSQFPALSLLVIATGLGVYAFFLLTLEELRREGGFERLVLLLSLVTLVIAAGALIDHVLHVNLSLRGSNLNQSSNLGGVEIWRAGGFFQDPQRAGAFLACMIAFLLILAVRGRFGSVGTRVVVWAAVAAGSGALITTVSRTAILACLLVSGTALFAFNRWDIAAKLAIVGAAALAGIVMALAPPEAWLSLVPATLAERFEHSDEEFANRVAIWFDTWEMFADHPITGIGPGSFQPYLIETRPTVFNYYEIGADEGVTYIPDQPESGYLKILYEGGIVGSIAALLVVGDALRRGVAITAGPGADARTEAIAALAGLATLGVTFVTLYTVSDPRIAGVLAFLLAVIWHRSLQIAGAARKA